MLAKKLARPLQFGNTLITQRPQLPHVNSNHNLDLNQPNKLLALLMLLKHHALLTRVAFTEQLFASKESNGSRPGICHLLPQPFTKQKIVASEPLKKELKGKMMRSGRLNLTISSTTISCSPQATSSIGSKLVEQL